MNRSNFATQTITLFLAFILIAETIAALSPSSFMKEIHTLSDSGIMMDKYKSKYASYEKDNIECTNFNLNVDGLNFNKIPESLNGLLAAQVQAESEEEWTDIGNSIFRNDEKRFGYDEIKMLQLYVLTTMRMNKVYYHQHHQYHQAIFWI